jgi:hypothetical protein
MRDVTRLKLTNVYNNRVSHVSMILLSYLRFNVLQSIFKIITRFISVNDFLLNIVVLVSQYRGSCLNDN